MIHISSDGKTFNLGSDDSTANRLEKPKMNIDFEYDFWIDSVEVTQERFEKLMGYNPVSVFEQAEWLSPNSPVVGLNWYEAALFCNALSKDLDLDTVYEYSSQLLSKEGIVEQLYGVQVHYDKLGIRLPTEAEWVYAAGVEKKYIWAEGQTVSDEFNDYAWVDANSDDQLKEVALLKANEHGLYDLAGNAMEWVGDWRGRFDSVAVKNYVGGSEGASEKVVKGGSFRHSWPQSRLGNRSDIYNTTPGTRAPYLGFRVAAGAFESKGGKGSVGKLEGEAPKVTATTKELIDFFHSYDVKLALVNKNVNRLAYIPLIKERTFFEWEDSIKIRHPSLSPAGDFIAYSNIQESFDKEGELHIVYTLYKEAEPWAPLDKSFGIPRWMIGSKDKDTSLILVNTGKDNSNGRNGETWKVPIDGGWFPTLDEATKLSSDYALHSGFTTDFKYGFSGFKELQVYDVENKTTTQLFTSPQNGKSPSGSDQVCNVSVAPDTTGKHLFIDFGYSAKSEVIGKSYGIHEYIFQGNLAGSIEKYYQVPEGYVGWDHVEYTNNPNYAVASVTDESGAHSAIYAIRLSDSTYLKIAEGEDLWHPNVVVNTTFDSAGSLPTDSVSRYNTPEASTNRMQIARKLHLFFKHRDSTDTYVLGSSRVLMGFDPKGANEGKFLNMGVANSGLKESLFLLKNYILNHSKNLQNVLIALDVDRMGVDPESFSQTHMRNVVGLEYDKSHDYFKTGLSDEYLSLQNSNTHNDIDKSIDEEGAIYLDPIGWGIYDEVGGRDWASETKNHENYEKNRALVTELMKLSDEHSFRLVFVIYPMHPDLKNSKWYGTYGPLKEFGNKIQESVINEAKAHSDVHLWDVHQNGEHGFRNIMARDADHLSGFGARKMAFLSSVYLNQLDSGISE